MSPFRLALLPLLLSAPVLAGPAAPQRTRIKVKLSGNQALRLQKQISRPSALGLHEIKMRRTFGTWLGLGDSYKLALTGEAGTLDAGVKRVKALVESVQNPAPARLEAPARRGDPYRTAAVVEPSYEPLRPPVRRVSYPMKVAGKGKDVRLRRLYDPQAGRFGDGILEQSDYDRTKKYVKAILTKFPPDKYYYVGIGRSPALTVAMLKNLSPDLAATFPVSGMRGVDGKTVFRQYPHNYTEHIDTLIPESVRKGDRKLLLIDHTRGPSLRGVKGVFDAYRQSGRALPEIEMVSIGVPVTGDDIHSISPRHAYHEYRGDQIAAEYEGEQPDKGHVIHSARGDLGALRRNPKYARFRRSLLKLMRRDQELDRFLESNFPAMLNTSSTIPE